MGGGGKGVVSAGGLRSPEEHDEERAERQGQHGGPEPAAVPYPLQRLVPQTTLGPSDLANLARLARFHAMKIAHEGGHRGGCCAKRKPCASPPHVIPDLIRDRAVFVDERGRKLDLGLNPG